MRVTHLLDPLLKYGMPLTCSFLALLAALLLPVLLRRVKSNAKRALFIVIGLAAFFALWHLLARFPAVERWLMPVGSPIIAVYLLIILPALYIPHDSRWYKLYLLVPASLVVFSVFAVFDAYRSVPESDQGFYWFLIRPAWLLAGVVSLLVLIQPFLTIRRFRFAVRLACFVVLVYGGFMFRQDYTDYQEMLQLRRQDVDIMMVGETSPVMQHDWRMLHLPSAPCRFTADGGYIQGCNLELFQRVMQADVGAVWRREEGAIATMAVIMGALTLFFTISFVAARWMCGWLCPLSAIGGVIDWIRVKLGLAHMKPAQPIKMTYLYSGLGIAGLTLAMAKVYPYLDEEGKFLGCKIPLYPFCKICPSQQLCPVVARGPANYPGLPNWEWGWGFFMAGCFAILTLFIVSFALGRRLWCRFCPMGMISGLFNRGGSFRLIKDAQKCNRCGVCKDVCPMDIDYIRSEMNRRDVSNFDCVLCLRCIEKCPKDGCLSLEHAGVKVTESRFSPEGGTKSGKAAARKK